MAKKKQPALPWAERPCGLRYRRCDVLAVENSELAEFYHGFELATAGWGWLISDRRVFQLSGFDGGFVVWLNHVGRMDCWIGSVCVGLRLWFVGVEVNEMSLQARDGF
jgi:hypothetical protein